MNFILGLVLFGMFCSMVATDEALKCSKAPSAIYPGEVDVHCSCMEKLIEFNQPIRKLTVNQTTCDKNVLKLNWNDLQAYIGVKQVVFDEANIIFDNSAEKMVNFSLTEVSFLNSFMSTISENTFKGLELIETIRFFRSEINVIGPNSFSRLHRLETVEFANSTINIIRTNAFVDLPLIKELGFINSYIGTLETNAIHITKPIDPPKEKCNIVRGRMSAKNLMYEFSGRSLDYLSNVSLPSLGTKLLFFVTEIQNINFMSVNTNIFSYIIIAGCTIRNFESSALAAVIQNECDISSFLLISNKINVIKSEAFADITGSETEPHNTVIAIVNNVFYTIQRKGLLLHPNIETLHVEGNKFSCTSCNKFSWLVSDEESKIQLLLEKKLLETGKCIGRIDLINYLKRCNEEYSTVNIVEIGESTVRSTVRSTVSTSTPKTTTYRIANTFDREHTTIATRLVAKSSSSPNKCNKYNLFSILLVFVLIICTNKYT